MKAKAKLGLAGLGLLLIVMAEIAAIVWVASEIGWWTVLILAVTTLLGLYLLQREWRKAWGQLVETAKSGQMPSGRLTDASLILGGGMLLVLPGLLTDVVGLLMLLPFTRPFFRSAISWAFTRTVAKAEAAARPGVIKGDVVDEPGTWVPEIEPRNDKSGPTVVEGRIVEDQ